MGIPCKIINKKKRHKAMAPFYIIYITKTLHDEKYINGSYEKKNSAKNQQNFR
jgi:hypothetical protein